MTSTAPPNPAYPGAEQHPSEADHEVGNGQRHHDQHGPDPAAGEVGPLDQPGGADFRDRAQGSDRDRQAGRVPEQLGGQRPVDQSDQTVGTTRPPGPLGSRNARGSLESTNDGDGRATDYQ